MLGSCIILLQSIFIYVTHYKMLLVASNFLKNLCEENVSKNVDIAVRRYPSDEKRMFLLVHVCMFV